MRGRKPKPAALVERDGDTRKLGPRKFQEKIASEPEAGVGLPGCPSHLKGRARKIWLFWRRELEFMDLDRRPDAPMLEGACVAYARAVDAEIMVTKDGAVIEEPITIGEAVVGYKRKTHPAVNVADKSWKQVKSFCCEFGLSPVSRARLAVGNPKAGTRGPVDQLESDLCRPLPNTASVQ